MTIESSSILLSPLQSTVWSINLGQVATVMWKASILPLILFQFPTKRLADGMFSMGARTKVHSAVSQSSFMSYLIKPWAPESRLFRRPWMT